MKKIIDIEKASANCECNNCGLTFLRCSKCQKYVKAGAIFCAELIQGNTIHYCSKCGIKQQVERK